MIKFSRFLSGFALMCVSFVQTHALSIGQFDYIFLSEEKLEARISGPAYGTTLSGDIVIPATVLRPSDGKYYKVVEVGPPNTNIRNENADWPAFYNLPEITSVTIPATVSYIWDESFSGCTGIKAFIVHADNPRYMSVDGVLYNKSVYGKMDALVRVPPAYPATTFTIPDGIQGEMDAASRSVCYGAFRDNSTITTLVIGKRVFFQEFAMLGNRGIKKFIGSDVRGKNINGILYDDEGTTLRHLPPPSPSGIHERRLQGARRGNHPCKIRLYGCADERHRFQRCKQDRRLCPEGCASYEGSHRS